MRALKFIIGHVTYNQAYTYKFQLKTTMIVQQYNENTVSLFLSTMKKS